MAGINEPDTKTLSRTKTWRHHRVASQRAVISSERRAEDPTGYETGPRDEGNDGPFAAGRKAIVDEIVASLSGCLGSQQRSLFCGHDLNGEVLDCVHERGAMIAGWLAHDRSWRLVFL